MRQGNEFQPTLYPIPLGDWLMVNAHVLIDLIKNDGLKHRIPEAWALLEAGISYFHDKKDDRYMAMVRLIESIPQPDIMSEEYQSHEAYYQSLI